MSAAASDKPWYEVARDRVVLVNRGGRPAPDTAVLARLLDNQEFRAARSRVDRVTAYREVLAGTADFELFYLFTYHPHVAIPLIGEDRTPTSQWQIAVDLYEAWWRLASTDQIPGGIEARAQRTATAYLARTRWVLYSLVFRPGSGLERDDFGPPTDQQVARPAPPDPYALPNLVVRARSARQDWITILDTVEDHTLLESDIDPESEARDLLACSVTAKAAMNSGSLPHATDAVDAATWRQCVRRQLLPRFTIWPAWRIAWRLSSPLTRVGVAVAALVFAAAVTLAGAAATPWSRGHDTAGLFTAAAITAAIGYAAIAATAVAERSTSWGWLLRQPAAAILGVLALITLNPGWWAGRQPKVLDSAAITLTVLAIGYLVIEAANHQVPPRRLPERVAVVTVLGLMHALLVATIALRWLLPALSESGPHNTAVNCLWSGQGCGTATSGHVLAAATAWCFAAGVFSQILWDEQPFTAPLAHLGWRNGR